MDHSLRYIIFFPLLGVIFNIVVGTRWGRRWINLISPGVVGLSFLLSCVAFRHLVLLPEGSLVIDRVYSWMVAGSLAVDVALRLDPLSAVMIVIVTGVGFLIHVYSVGYMAEDQDVARYFAYLNLFMVTMLLLVLADNLLLFFVGWEGVGLCSYLLIGFWYEDPVKASAGKKAFIVNRIGDAGFLLGMLLLFGSMGQQGVWSLNFVEVQRNIHLLPIHSATAVALLLFAGATGKSAQIPLYVWLPDAMAGPTPVSALIHAATMVTAGVYMVSRLHFLYALSPVAQAVVAGVGAATALFAATIALVQTDVKRVLAYSTVSQLGYMFLAVGVGAYGAGIFHLLTHAFFKALLFLGAGSVIHAMQGEQDVQRMGGLRPKMPVTYVTFLIACLAIAGIPGLSGFFSKDAILGQAYGEHVVLWGASLVGAGLTAFYIFRLFFLVFGGAYRGEEALYHHVHESPSVMTIPLGILALLSTVGGWVGLPSGWLWGDLLERFLDPVFLSAPARAAVHGTGTEWLLMLLTTAVGLAGIALAYVMYIGRPQIAAHGAESLRRLYRLVRNTYYVDELYDFLFVRPTVAVAQWFWQFFDVAIIDGLVNGAAATVSVNGAVWRRWQTGRVQHYVFSFLVGAVCVVAYYLFP